MASDSAPSSLSSTIRMRRPTAGVGSLGTGWGTCLGMSDRAGRRTVNSLPWPRPSLCTCTVPPCISTRVFTSVRPMPSPSRERSSDVSTCVNISKTLGRCSAAMPMPLSRTRTTACLSILLDRQPDVPAPVRELAGIVQQVADDLSQPRGVGVEVDRLSAAG